MPVVAWAPVPNAWPGSMTTSMPASSSASRPGMAGSAAGRPVSHEGRTTIRPPATATGSWKSRQRSAQSSGISVELISTSPSPAAASSVGELRQLARRPVDRVLVKPAASSASRPGAAGSATHPPPRPRRAPARAARRAPRSASSGRQRTASRITRRRATRAGARRGRAACARACVGTTTSKTTCCEPRRPLRSDGRPSPLSRSRVARLGAGGDLRPRARRRASGRSDLAADHRQRSPAPRRTVIRSSPRRSKRSSSATSTST